MTAAAMPQDETSAMGRLQVGTFLYVLLIAVIGFLVIYPLGTLVVTSFQIGALGRETTTGFGNWLEAFHNDQMASAFWNTLSLSFTRQFLALIFGVGIAWVIARTNLPGRGWIEVGFWIALFMPSLPVTMAWVLLAGGKGGLLNMWLHELFPFIHGSVFDVFSWWGIIWVHLVTGVLPVKVFLLVPALRNMDSALEESSRACGANMLKTLTRIVVPIMLPTIVMVMLLGMIRSMHAFEIELILGPPANIDVYSTLIYRVMKQEPPLYGIASVMSILFVTIIIPFVLAQHWYGNKHSHSTVGGKFSLRLQDLGGWKWPIFWLLMLLVLVMTVVPLVVLVFGSFMKIFGMFDLPNPWTTRHWIAALSRQDLKQSLINSLSLGLGSAAVGMVLFSVVAYVSVKTRYFGRGLLDFLTWLPTMIPGIVISLGFLQMFVGTPVFRPIYGTIWVLIIAVVLANVTVGVQLVKNNLLQLNAELEEASWASGGSRLYTFWKIVIPLVMPSVIIVGLQTFATAVAAVGVIAMLGTGPNQPLSILQLVYLDSGRFEPATIVGLLILIITVVAALVAKFFSNRYGVGIAKNG
ncbi:MAG TPA: iron ABC transporter permease [Alphaproteobacteria bacterium]|jgi:iron(III) transport system permease protein